MAFKKIRRRPFKRVVYPSKPIDVVDIKYRSGGGYQHEADVGNAGSDGRNWIDVEIAQFDVYLNGVWKGTFDNSPTGLIDFLEAMR